MNNAIKRQAPNMKREKQQTQSSAIINNKSHTKGR